MESKEVKILAIDDNKVSLIIINALVKDAFPEAIILNAPNGKTGLELAAKEDPDVILLDIIMPGMDGYKVCQKLKADKKLCDIPVVFVTAIKDNKEGLIRALECGGEAFLTKPIDEIELTAQIRAMLKIRNANIQKRDEKERLSELVEEKTRELNKAYKRVLNLLEDLKKENEARIKSEERFKVVAESADEWIWEVDNEGMYTYSSPMVEKILGYTPEEIIGKKYFYDFFKDDVKQQLKEGAFSVFKQKLVFKSFENSNIHKNGQIVFVNTSGSPILDNKGNLIGYSGADRDITKSKLAEADLKKLNFAINNTNEVVFMTDKEGTITYINPEFTKMYGYTAGEVVGRTTPRILNSGLYPKEYFEQFYNKLNNKQTVTATQYQNKCKDGKLIDVEGSAAPIINENSEIIGFLGIQRDITERKRSEQIQKVLYNISNAVNTNDNLEKLFDQIQKEIGAIIDSANFYIALYDDKTDMFSLPFIADEKEGFKTFPAGKSFTNYVLKTKKPLLANKEKVKEMVKTGDLELVGTASEIWLGVPLITEGKVTGVLAVQSYTDENAYAVSDMKMLEFVADHISISIKRKMAEEELKLALNKATKSDRLKTSFINNISHEIRTPLNGILGFAPFITQPDISFEEKEMYLNILNVSSARLMNTVTSYMDISLIASGNMEVHSEQVDLSSIMQEIYEHFLQQCLEKNLELKMNLPKDAVELILKTDGSLLSRILSHLVDNAVKFTKEGSIEFGYRLDRDTMEVELIVMDTGQGISFDAQKLVFDAFMQENVDNTRGYEGSGLGLSIAKGLTELLGGKIRLESEKDMGTTIFVTLPVEAGSLPEKVKEVTSKNRGEKFGTILIAEYENLNYLFIKKVLEGHVDKILMAENGQEAVDLCHKYPEIDLVLMDIKMPVMNGMEATRQIKSFRKDLPIIAVTAYALTGDKHKFIEAGCDDYISKPIYKEILLGLIQKHFKK